MSFLRVWVFLNVFYTFFLMFEYSMNITREKLNLHFYLAAKSLSYLQNRSQQNVYVVHSSSILLSLQVNIIT